MPLPVEGYIRPILRPYEERIGNVVTKAWDTWFKSTSKRTFAYRRVRASAVHELMVREARREFERDRPREVRIIEGPETIYLQFKESVVVRLKKGDRNGMGRNNPTQTSLAFITPSADVHELPLGLPNVQRADVTYILNKLETRIEQVLVVGRDGGRRLWKYGIYPRAAVVAPVAVFPIKPKAPTRPDDVVRVPSRRDEKKDVS
jgi:hypothetical protein